MGRTKLWIQSVAAWGIVLVLALAVFSVSGAVALGITRTITSTPTRDADGEVVAPVWVAATLATMGFIALAGLGLERRAQHRADAPKIRAEASIVIAKPIIEVFAFVADMRNDPLIAPQIVSIRRTSVGPVRVGTTYDQVFRSFGRTREAHICVTAYEPHIYLATRDLIGYRVAVASYTLVDVPKGTRLTATCETLTSILNVPGTSLSAWLMRVQLRKQLGRLKHLLENEANSGQ